MVGQMWSYSIDDAGKVIVGFIIRIVDDVRYAFKECEVTMVAGFDIEISMSELCRYAIRYRKSLYTVTRLRRGKCIILRKTYIYYFYTLNLLSELSN